MLYEHFTASIRLVNWIHLSCVGVATEVEYERFFILAQKTELYLTWLPPCSSRSCSISTQYNPVQIGNGEIKGGFRCVHDEDSIQRDHGGWFLSEQVELVPTAIYQWDVHGDLSHQSGYAAAGDEQEFSIHQLQLFF